MAKVIKYIKFSAIVLLLLGLIAYLVFAMFTMTEPDPDERCKDVELVVSKNSKVNFVDSKSMEALLKSHHLYPKGKLLKDVDTRSIESLIAENDFVEKVECYKTSGGKLSIHVEQRNPVMYIIPDGQDGYYVDRSGKVIPSNVFTTNMVVATGDISRKFASEELSDFGSFLQRNEFWNGQIEQVYVSKGSKGEPVVELIPRVGDHVVYLGTFNDYEKKLRRLKIFYEKAMGTVGWNKYGKINLEYKNQIICTVRKR
ncbi:MAG: cell division protein FtsQ [Bacteroidaceae bacterium]|nr:cell division protein FtsQ [Bacteroidaceae bacterium]